MDSESTAPMNEIALKRKQTALKYFQDDLTDPSLWQAPIDVPTDQGDALRQQLFDMLLIRRAEEVIAELVETGEVKCPCHLAIGQEAVAVGVSTQLKQNDKIFGAHRSHAHYMAVGGDLDALFAEIYGKETGCSKGMGGSMHLYAGDKGFMGSVPIVAGTVSLAVGAAIAAKKDNKKAVAVAYFGDGACEEGVIHECLNLASVMQLPVLFVIENNLFSSHLDIQLRQPSPEISRFAVANCMEYRAIDGNDILAVQNASEDLIGAMRAHNKPAMLEAVTYRHRGHVGPKEDIDVGLRRSPSELAAWKKCDPVERLKTGLMNKGFLTEEEYDKAIEDIRQRVALAAKKAKEAPYPEAKSLMDRVYNQKPFSHALQSSSPKDDKTVKMNYGEAIRDAHAFLLKEDPGFFVMGQGVWSPWYVGNSMTDLDKDFGKDRVIDTPVSENACTGAAVGAGLCGYRTLVIHPRIDFMSYCIDPIINQAAKWGHMLGGQAFPNVTIRGIINRGGEQGAQHSQALHSWFAHIPGLRVVMPGTVKDARDLLVASALCEDPVIYIDDRWLYDEVDELSATPEILDLRDIKPEIRHEGSDVTIVAASYSLSLALKTAALLKDKNISAEVIDLRVINPINYDTICQSVSKTGRLCVIDGGWETCGLAGEIIAGVSERTPPAQWKAMPARITLPAAPAPTSHALEKIYYPDVADILARIRGFFK